MTFSELAAKFNKDKNNIRRLIFEILTESLICLSTVGEEKEFYFLK